MQPPIQPTVTIRAQTTTTVEVNTAAALITVGADTLTVMTRQQLHVIAWPDLIELLSDLAAEYTADERVQILTVPSPEEIIEANRAALRGWLLERPGVVLASNGHGNGVTYRDDYSPGAEYQV